MLHRYSKIIIAYEIYRRHIYIYNNTHNICFSTGLHKFNTILLSELNKTTYFNVYLQQSLKPNNLKRAIITSRDFPDYCRCILSKLISYKKNLNLINFTYIFTLFSSDLSFVMHITFISYKHSFNFR
jgi:hypothetical protein